MLDTIQRVSQKVRIAYGDHNLTHGKDRIPEEFRHFVMIIYQGNACEPQIWSIISSIVFSSLCTQGFSIHFINSFKTEIAQLVGFIYVDDCDMIQSDDDIAATHSQMKLTIIE